MVTEPKGCKIRQNASLERFAGHFINRVGKIFPYSLRGPHAALVAYSSVRIWCIQKCRLIYI